MRYYWKSGKKNHFKNSCLIYSCVGTNCMMCFQWNVLFYVCTLVCVNVFACWMSEYYCYVWQTVADIRTIELRLFIWLFSFLMSIIQQKEQRTTLLHHRTKERDVIPTLNLHVKQFSPYLNKNSAKIKQFYVSMVTVAFLLLFCNRNDSQSTFY